MVMTEVFDKLKSLQSVLAEKYTLEVKINDSPKELDQQEELLARLKKEYIEKHAIYEEVKARVERLREDLASAEASRESGEKGMDSITSHREYEALDKQITEATERGNSIRKDLQNAELNEILHGDEEMIAAQEKDLNDGKASLQKEIDSYKEQLVSLSKKEEEIIPGIDQEIVYKFQRIIKRNSEGIVAVKNGVCMGCHMILPAQFANEVHEGDKILFCPYCSRILYYQEADEGEEENYFSVDDTGSLADFEDEFADEFADENEEDDENIDSDDDGGEKSLEYDD